MLHITNGDNANEALKNAGIEGRFLAWSDVLHDGPVPAQLTLDEMSQVRANFIHHCGWASEFEALTHFQARDAMFISGANNGEVVIWNSPELYDQLHLLQLLSWYNSDAAQGLPLPQIVFAPFLLGMGSADEMQEAFNNNRSTVTPEQLQAADEAWFAFTAANPRPLSALLRRDLGCLPYLLPGMQRMLQEYPDAQGVNRTERQILQAVAEGVHKPGELFGNVRNREETPFMGDSSFWLFIKGMLESETALLETADGTAFKLPGMFGPDEAFLSQQLNLTAAGVAVLNGELDWLQGHGIDRWIGGVHLNPENIWRWHADRGEFSRS